MRSILQGGFPPVRAWWPGTQPSKLRFRLYVFENTVATLQVLLARPGQSVDLSDPGTDMSSYGRLRLSFPSSPWLPRAPARLLLSRSVQQKLSLAAWTPGGRLLRSPIRNCLACWCLTSEYYSVYWGRNPQNFSRSCARKVVLGVSMRKACERCENHCFRNLKSFLQPCLLRKRQETEGRKVAVGAPGRPHKQRDPTFRFQGPLQGGD